MQVIEKSRGRYKVVKTIGSGRYAITRILSQERIEAYICLNFAAYKVYKELERVLKIKKAAISLEKVIEIIQNIYEISLLTPNNEFKKKLSS